jgi:hypothetical protein
MTNSLHRVATIVCVIFCLAFGCLSYSAALTKSATFDEPLHLVGGYLHHFDGDFRINPEDPPLFGAIAAVGMRADALRPDRSGQAFGDAAETSDSVEFVVHTLYASASDGDALLQTARQRFAIIGVCLGGLIACAAWRVAGPASAMVACALFCLDPNFLGHAGIVKNDVLISGCMLLLALCLWRLGTTGAWQWLAAAALTTAAAVGLKFTGILFAPIIAVILLIRAAIPENWPLCGVVLRTPYQRIVGAIGVYLIVGLIAWAGIWAAYGFQYAATPDGKLLDTSRMIGQIRQGLRTRELYEAASSDDAPDQTNADGQAGPEPAGGERTPADAALPVTARAILTIEKLRLLPQPWTFGLLFTYNAALNRPAFLMGRIGTGFVAYFPLAIVFKTPVATLAAFALSALTFVIAFADFRRDRRRADAVNLWPIVFLWTCLLVPPVFYFAVAILHHVNIGVRHILPVYPFAFVIVGIAAAQAIRRQRVTGMIVSAILLIGLAGESLSAYPNYIAFFNQPSDRIWGRIHLLGDSNLDWGQDLKLLAAWQREHPTERLHICYFGTPDPACYGVSAHILPGNQLGYGPDHEPLPRVPAVFAISATQLQGIYAPSYMRNFYGTFLHFKPRAVLGETIYLYDWRPPP